MADEFLIPQAPDNPPATEQDEYVIKAPSAAETRDYTLGERLGRTFTEQADTGTFGIASTGARIVQRNVAETPEDADYHQYLLDQRALRKTAYENMSWSRTPLEFGAALVGGLAASAPDPLSYINTLPGMGTLVGSTTGRFMGDVGQRIAAYAVSQGVVNAGQDAVSQAVEISGGIRKEYDAAQTGMAFGFGTVLGGAFGSIGEVQARYARFRTATSQADLARFVGDLENDARIAASDRARVAVEDPALVGPDDIASIKEAQRAEAGRQAAVPDAARVRQSGGVPDGVEGNQGQVGGQGQPLGRATPEARFGGDFYERPLSAQVSAPKVAEDLGVDIPGTLLKELRGEPKVVIAHHGSPHDFDRFSMDKIGTGEGAQAYGHGLYFAENQGVAKGYQRALSNGLTADGIPINDGDVVRRHVAGLLHEGESADAIRRRAQLDLDAMTRAKETAKPGELADIHEALTKARETLAAVNDLAGKKIEMAPGSLYQVRINADPDHFLDWDKPYIQQSDVVKRGLDEAGFAPPPGGELMTGAELYERMNRTDGGAWGSAKQYSANALRELGGIPGIKYLDAGSRGAGEGSRNYVVFDDKLIQIIGKDGKPVPLNDYLKGQANAKLVEEIRATPVTPELKADLKPEAPTTEAERIVAAAVSGDARTVADVEARIIESANAQAPEGKVLSQESADDIAEVVRGRAAAGDPDILRRTQTAGQGTAPPAGQQATAAAATPNAARQEVKSVQDLSIELANDLNIPLRQGRVQGGKNVLGQYDTKQGTVRVRAIADYETVAHEAGHALEGKLGRPLKDMIQAHAAELGPLDTLNANPREGFGLWFEAEMVNPGMGATRAPLFDAAFRSYMADSQPDLWAKIQKSQAAYQAWLNAPTGEKVAAWVKQDAPDTMFGKIARSLRENGMARSVSLMLGKFNDVLFDDNMAVTQAVREIARQVREASGIRMSLEGTKNPENMVRLLPRAGQAAVSDALVGVRGYRSTVPQGPSLRDAVIMATGQKGLLGFWNDAKVKEFDEYLVARRMSVLWDKFNAQQLERRPGPITKPDIDAEIARMESVNPNLAAAAQMVHDYTRQLLKKMYDGGLIDADTFGTLSAERFYVPMYRDMSDKAGASGGRGQGADGPGTTQVIKRMRGSDRNVISPIQSVMTQTFLVNRTIQHNEAIRSFVQLSREAQRMGAVEIGRIVEEIPAHKLVGKKFDLQEMVRAVARNHDIDPQDAQLLSQSVSDIFGDDPIFGTLFRAEQASKNGEPIIFYKEGGQLRAVRFINKKEGMALYEALTQMPTHAMDIGLEIARTSAAALRIGVTTNPVFAVTNFVRDQLAATILRSDYIPFDPRGLVSDIRQDNYAQLYAYAGGMSPGAGAQGLDDMMNKSIDALARKGWLVQKVGDLSDLFVGKGMQRVTGPMKAIGETVQASESGTRINIFRTVYKQKIAQGLSDYDAMIEAAAQSTDIMDFSRHGSGTLYLRQLVPFLNAQFQGLAKAGRTLVMPLYRAATGDMVTRQDEAALRNAAFAWVKLAAVGGGLGYLYGLWAQKYRAYQDADTKLRANHLIIPGDPFGMPGKVLVVPKPFELAIGFNLGEMAALGIGAKDPRAWDMAYAGAAEVLLPQNVAESVTALKIPFELSANRSLFTKRDIVPSDMVNLPAKDQFTSNTSSLAKQLGAAIGVSPIKVDYAIGAQFSLWGRDILAMSNATDPDKPAASDYDQMFKRRFIKRADAASETTRQFWDMAASQTGKMAAAKKHYDDLVAKFKDSTATEFLAALPRTEKVFTVMSSGATEDGKPAFKTDDRRVHPLVRAAEAVSVIRGLREELVSNSQKAYETGSVIALDPNKRRDIIENLRVLAAMEQYNGLVLTRQKGYENRATEDTGKQLEVIRAISPEIGNEVATRYATAKIYKTEAVRKAWPDMERRVLADGSNADVGDLTADVVGEGYEFDAERVKRPAKRRIPVHDRALALPQ